MVHGGDIINTQKAASSDFEALQKVHELALSEGLPIFAIEGNHDKSSPPWSALAGKTLNVFPVNEDGVHELPDSLAGGIYDITGKTFSWRGLIFAGLGSIPAFWAADLISKARESQRIDVIVWHGAVRELIGFPSDESLCLQELDLSGLSCLMLGDIHVRGYIEKDGCVAGYPGASEVIKYRDPLDPSITLFDTSASPWTYKFQPIRVRKTLAFRIGTEQELMAALGETRAVAEDHPVILGRYSRELEGVVERFNSVVDPAKAVIRLKPLPPVELLRLDKNKPTEWQKPMLEDTLPRFFPEETELSALALRLCRNVDEPSKEIENYIQGRKEVAMELETTKRNENHKA